MKPDRQTFVAEMTKQWDDETTKWLCKFKKFNKYFKWTYNPNLILSEIYSVGSIDI